MQSNTNIHRYKWVYTSMYKCISIYTSMRRYKQLIYPDLLGYIPGYSPGNQHSIPSPSPPSSRPCSSSHHRQLQWQSSPWTERGRRPSPASHRREHGYHKISHSFEIFLPQCLLLALSLSISSPSGDSRRPLPVCRPARETAPKKRTGQEVTVEYTRNLQGGTPWVSPQKPGPV